MDLINGIDLTFEIDFIGLLLMNWLNWSIARWIDR